MKTENGKTNMNIQLFGTNTLTGNGGLTELDDTQISKVLLKRLLPKLRAYQDGQKTILKTGHGMNVEWTRFEELEDNDAEIEEGVSPESEALNPTIITARAKQYARTIKLTDILIQRGKHKAKAEAAELLKEKGAKMIDRITINEMSKATKVYCGNNKTSATITKNDMLKESDIERARLYLANNDAETFDDGTYHVLITPKLAHDVRKMQSFIDKSKYQDPQGKGLRHGEIGQLLGLTFIETTNIPSLKAGSGNDVECEQMIAYGISAYGVVDVEEQGSGGKPKFISKELGSGGTEDPANQRASAAIKFMYTTKILDEKRICKVIAPSSITL